LSTILRFPVGASVAPPSPAPRAAATASRAELKLAQRRGEYAVGDVARRLRISHLSPRRVIETLRVLARHDNMPMPETPRLWRGRPVSGPRAIFANSRWESGRFDAWLDGRDPGPATAAPAPAAGAQPARTAPPVRDMMRERARQLAVGASA
jgi:hypothetical protein